MKKIITLFVSSLILALMSSPAMATATKLGITTQPSGAVNGIAFTSQPVIAIQDLDGDTVTGDSTTIVTVAKASGSGILSGTLTATAVNGVATFSGLKIEGTGAHTLIFTSGALSSVTSASFTVAAFSAGAHLILTTQPSGAVNDVAFTGQPVIAIKDSLGNTVTTDNSTIVTVAKASGSGTLSGTLTATAINGVATFSGLKIVGTGAHTLIFTAGGLDSVTSASLTVAAATSSSGGGSSTVTAPVTTPAPTPGFFSGAKWTITVDDAGVSTLDINLAKSQAGKNASFYKRTKQGKLILLDEEQRLGKNGEASITTDKLLRTGQKVRVQVDGKFRSTVTMP